MKTVLKFLVVGLMAFALSFSPALAGLAKADGFNFEGISSLKTDDSQSYEKQPRGLMFNFSFGGPKDYKKTESLVAMMNEGKVTSAEEEMNEGKVTSLEEEKFWTWVGGLAVVGIIAFGFTYD